jgi:hypothetical protein
MVKLIKVYTKIKVLMHRNLALGLAYFENRQKNYWHIKVRMLTL